MSEAFRLRACLMDFQCMFASDTNRAETVADRGSESDIDRLPDEADCTGRLVGH